ncbi:pseudouridine-5'-phosphate glycosidase [uncultured Ferrovibrio sp.]|jgi:pseudouridine-5'-phosphate glycosidase|uniref:pseudouridine-5'-phosphate glycosidase n=1 Tax=uncultured Ferrovibrio sp. TaxID=1576913 RepID=UPI002615FA1B|nr:pseudouridine-5'-phosphate glycosidase [uncultured Ferrovibrio sp.]
MRDKAAGLPLVIAPEVAAALAERHPVVALESTIVSHGMPYPDNLAMAQTVERIVHDHGAVPATIAVIAGEFRIGLDAAALKAIAADRQAAKASSRDLAIMAVQKRNAGTTVSATMLLAALAGIEVFATGGIGGVHRGAEQTFDISADLIELGRTPVAVVCAGAKSILDIPKTLEVLETQRVPVIGVGTSDFPAFFTRSSGCKTDLRLDTAAEIAAAIKLHRQLGSGSGLLIANPIPEADSLDAAMIDTIIADALAEAEQRGIAGKAVTPFLLDRINKLTAGASLKANIALVKNNAALAAQIAVERAKLA